MRSQKEKVLSIMMKRRKAKSFRWLNLNNLMMIMTILWSQYQRISKIKEMRKLIEHKFRQNLKLTQKS